ncbi:hypothetical protein BEH_24685 (plasmid) [Priestia filamentosa]|uniref:DUF4352 domain-containing protein n=1 Tax=Priestia filamentosa TaxID=1402861 RepID=A0A2L1FFQ7_9BACI|nr:hypothetical protein [Priestia filamentosa]AVD54562.1 hypothetical protein CKF96_03390 [Priestia filamentosa]AWG44898.1 hypothetical protein BEH_24685 [Priestia filamentosa]
MKSLVKVTCSALILTSLMVGCSEQTTSTKQKETHHKVEVKPKEMSEEERLEKGILLYGQSSKGGYYLATVENAEYAKEDETGYLTARVTINNVRDDEKSIDLSEIKYTVKDEKLGKTYEGQAMPMDEDKFKNVPVSDSLTFNVSFEMENPPKDLNNLYLYLESNIDPFADTHWKLDNLASK